MRQAKIIGIDEDCSEIYIKRRKKNFRVVIFDNDSFSFVKKKLEILFEISSKIKNKAILAHLGTGMFNILKIPYKITSGMILSLEKISHSAKTKFGFNTKKKTISNPASGILLGTASVFK